MVVVIACLTRLVLQDNAVERYLVPDDRHQTRSSSHPDVLSTRCSAMPCRSRSRVRPPAPNGHSPRSATMSPPSSVAHLSASASARPAATGPSVIKVCTSRVRASAIASDLPSSRRTTKGDLVRVDTTTNDVTARNFAGGASPSQSNALQPVPPRGWPLGRSSCYSRIEVRGVWPAGGCREPRYSRRCARLNVRCINRPGEVHRGRRAIWRVENDVDIRRAWP